MICCLYISNDFFVVVEIMSLIIQNEKPNIQREKVEYISKIFHPTRGNKGLRAERYTLNEAKILPHIRAGIDLSNTIQWEKKLTLHIY